MLGMGLNSPSLFAAYPCSPSVCAEVHATAKSRLEEGDVDGLVRSRFADSSKRLQPLATGSRMLRQVGEVCALTGDKDPLDAMTNIISELKELRAIKERVLQGTGQLSVDGAMAVIEVAMRDRTELRTAEDALNTALGADGWRAVSAEVEAGRHLEQRVRAFAGVASGSSSSLEAALRTLHHRERERLALVQLRNDVLAVAGQASAPAAPTKETGRAPPPPKPSEEAATADAVRAVCELVEAANAIKALAKKPALADALAALRQPSSERAEAHAARKRLRRLHTQLLVASRSLPHALHRHYLGDVGATPLLSPAAAPSAAGSERSAGDAALLSDRSGGTGRSPERPSPERALAPGTERAHAPGTERALAPSADGDSTSELRSQRTERGSSRARVSARALAAGGAATAPAADEPPPPASERDQLVDGEEDTDDDDEEEFVGQRAWRRTGAFLGAILGSAGEGGAAAAAAGPPSSAPTAAGVHVPRLPIGPGGPAAAPSAEPPAPSGRSAKGKSSSARHASPRRGAGATTNSPRGSPTSNKSGATTTRPPSNAAALSKKRPPSAPAPSAPLSGGSSTSLGCAVPALVSGNGVGGVVGAGLGSGLVLAWNRDWQQTSLIGIGARALIHEARRIPNSDRSAGSERLSLGGAADDPKAAALCALVLDDDTWDVAREELKALGTLHHAHVMSVHGWYERRLAPTPSRPAAYEVCVAAQLMHGGDLLQRACARRYAERDVRRLAVCVCEALSVLDYAQIRHVDVAPWSLLYATPAAGKLADGLVVTNAAFAAPAEARGRDAPIRAAFDAPEVHAGRPREMPAAMYTLGRVLELLLYGDSRAEHRPSAPDGADTGTPADGAVSDEGAAIIESLCHPSPQARPRPIDALRYKWLSGVRQAGDETMDAPTDGMSAEDGTAAAEAPAAAGETGEEAPPPNVRKLYGGSGEAAQAASAREQGDATEVPPEHLVPLTSAHERLNRWYDDYLFEGMTQRLAEMADG